MRGIVIGASVAGCLCARALSGGVDEVVIVERDEDLEAVPRRAVPQGRQVHVVWHTGLAAMERLEPGLLDELVAGGATRTDVGLEFGWWQRGTRRMPVATGWRGLSMSRPFLESTLRRRVRSAGNVRLLPGRVGGLTVTGGAVDGVLVAHGERGELERLQADVVVDCSGRSGQLGSWLAALGYRVPPPVQVTMDVAYASREFRRAPGGRLSDGTNGLVALSSPPSDPRSVVVVPVEDDRWLVGVSSYGEDRPTADPADHRARCAAVGVGPLDDLLAGGEPLTAVATHRLPTSIRRDYHRAGSLPAGLAVAGDAVASFNPVYGQGMTCAALHADVLRRQLAGGLLRDSAEYFSQVKRVTDRAWTLSVTEDFRLPTTAGVRPPAATLTHRLGDLYGRAMLRSPAAHRRFLQVASMEQPPQALLAPGALVEVGRALLRW